MALSRCQCRAHLSEADLRFITRVFAERSLAELELLLAEPESRDALLDEARLFEELMECQEIIPISQSLYFYILLRRVLSESLLSSRDIADYIGSTLARILSMQQKLPPLYIVDALDALDGMNDAQQFYMRAELADAVLILTGFFPEYLKARTERSAAPPLSFYEGVGKSQYDALSKHRLAEEHEVSGIFLSLSSSFSRARTALNDLSERLISLGDPPFGPLK